MAMAPFGPAELMMVLAMLGGFVGLPLSVPPLPPDPIVQRALPDDCLFAIHYSGYAKPSADSKNQTEQLLAEEEVQQFINQVGSEILKVVRQKSAGDPKAEKLAAELPTILKALATRPLSLYLASVEITPAGPDIRGGMIVNAGPEAKTLEESLNRLQAFVLADAPPHIRAETVEIAGIKFTKLPTPPNAPSVVWGFKGPFLLAAVGNESAAELIGRLADKHRRLPGWYTELQKQAPVERLSSISYINMAGILKAAEPAMTDPKVKPVLAAVGIDKLQSIGSVAGLNATGMTSNLYLQLDGSPTGIFALASNSGITSSDLSIIPADVVMAQVVKVDLAEVYQHILEGVGKVEPGARAQAEAHLKQIENNFGLSLEEDLLKPIGDTWSIFGTPGAGIGIPTGLAITVSLRDAEKFSATHARLLALASGIVGQASQGKISIKESDYKGTRLYTIQGSGDAAMPVSPTWCLTKDRLIVTLYPQMAKTLLARTSNDKSLADIPEVQSRLSEGPITLGYRDSAAMLNSTYSMYQVFAPMIQGQMAGQGLEVELPTLPTQASIMPHIRPHVSTLRKMPDGLKFEGRYTMPVAVGADPTTIGVGVALLLPAVQAAREAARRNQSTNNMKQIMLAFHNHHDVYKKFPAAAITDKEEKPLLSWRVKILPFIDEGELYKEFHLDEPWDSEHNKKLIPRMPVAYLNPSRANNGDGTTTYLLPTGKSSLFKDPVKAVNLREIVDGTSRTIAVVEADEDRAVAWTKPDDLKLDADKPLKGLGNLRPGGFLAAFADGSVRFIPNDIDKTVLQALFTRDGREVVEIP